MSNECKKLFGLMKFDVEGAVCNIGLEQELFFVPRDKYYSRQDLQFTGRTLGKMCARGQEGCDHYMGPINMNGPVLNCMQEIQLECYTCAGGRAFEPPTRRSSTPLGVCLSLSSSQAPPPPPPQQQQRSSSSSSGGTMRFCSALTPTPAPRPATNWPGRRPGSRPWRWVLRSGVSHVASFYRPGPEPPPPP
jgi:hypothetical protein